MRLSFVEHAPSEGKFVKVSDGGFTNSLIDADHVESEALPEGIVANSSDLEMRPLWDSAEGSLSSSSNLFAMAVGNKQKDLVNKMVTKFLSNDFVVMLLHYDGVVDEWKDLEWSERVIHSTAAYRRRGTTDGHRTWTSLCRTSSSGSKLTLGSTKRTHWTSNHPIPTHTLPEATRRTKEKSAIFWGNRTSPPPRSSQSVDEQLENHKRPSRGEADSPIKKKRSKVAAAHEVDEEEDWLRYSPPPETNRTEVWVKEIRSQRGLPFRGKPLRLMVSVSP
ncbi:hypothetical protein NL676_021477 [Syzygium grande]|nr:hypothetical protein NL676_021477 [Syzygium grande]